MRLFPIVAEIRQSAPFCYRGGLGGFNVVSGRILFRFDAAVRIWQGTSRA
jgi:hypothetical protein